MSQNIPAVNDIRECVYLVFWNIFFAFVLVFGVSHGVVTWSWLGMPGVFSWSYRSAVHVYGELNITRLKLWAFYTYIYAFTLATVAFVYGLPNGINVVEP
jgi:hypothetical protein